MIAIGSDHGGFGLKQAIISHLEQKGRAIRDVGCHSLDSCDYPDFGQAAAELVAQGVCRYGIVICTTGIGISIAANKVEGIRCALCTSGYQAKMTKLHNDANMLALGAGVVGEQMALEIVDLFLETEFCREERHARRVGKLEKQAL